MDPDIVYSQLHAVFGPLSSVFDFVTFGLLLLVFRTNETLFHTGWFMESLSTQILVIFIIRTAHPLRDRPHPALVASSLSAFALAVALPYSPLGHWLGFVPVPAAIMGALMLTTLAYLVAVHAEKRWFFKHYQLNMQGHALSRLTCRDAESTLRAVTAWGRYAELFAYDDEARTFALIENPA